MIFELTVLAAVLFAFALTVLLWPLAVKPALRRRYERAHFRRKAQRATRASNTAPELQRPTQSAT